MKRLSLLRFYGAEGYQTSAVVAISEQQARAFERKANILNAAKPDTFIKKSRVEILAESGIQTPAMSTIETIERNIFIAVVQKMGESMEFNRENIETIQKDVSTRVSMLTSLNSIDRFNTIRNIVKTVVQQRVYEICTKRGLTKGRPFEMIEPDHPEATMMMQLKADMYEMIFTVGDLLGIELRLPKR